MSHLTNMMPIEIEILNSETEYTTGLCARNHDPLNLTHSEFWSGAIKSIDSWEFAKVLKMHRKIQQQNPIPHDQNASDQLKAGPLRRVNMLLIRYCGCP